MDAIMISLPRSKIQIEHVIAASNNLVEVIFQYADSGERDIKILAVTEDVWSRISDPKSYPSAPVDESTCTAEFTLELEENEWRTLKKWCDRFHISVDKWVRAILRFYVDPANREAIKWLENGEETSPEESEN